MLLSSAFLLDALPGYTKNRHEIESPLDRKQGTTLVMDDLSAKMPTAWIFAVVSSSKQDDTIEHQLTWARTSALEHGWTITREFSGVSTGKHGTRKLLDDLVGELRACARGLRPDRVLMIRIDRLGRGDSLDTIAALAEIRKLGVLVHTREDGDVAVKRATDALVPALRSITAALENETRGERSRAMHARKRAAGEVQGLPPYGFIVVEKRLVIYDPEAAFVRDLFERRARGWSYSKLSAHARELAPAKRRNDGALQPLRWSTTTLTRMLANPAYRGSIVDADLWDEVFRMRLGTPIAHRPAKYPWPLRGAVRCVCGLKMTGRASGAGKYRRRYYVCVDAAAHNGYPGHDAATVERAFARFLEKLEASPELIAGYQRKTGDDGRLRAQRAAAARDRDAIAGRRDRVWKLAEENRLPGDELAARLEKLRSEAATTDARIAELDRQLAQNAAARSMWSGLRESLTIMAQTWMEAPIDLRQEIAQAVAAIVGGFWLDPLKRGELLVGGHGESRRKADDGITKKFIQSISE